MKKIFFLVCILNALVPAYADLAGNLSRQFNQIFVDSIRTKVAGIPKNSSVVIFLKDGTSVTGIFRGYVKYDDGVWIRPLNSSWGFLSDDAYDVRQILDIRIVILRDI